MAVVLAIGAGAMPARPPQLNSALESVRRLKSALATPRPHSRSASQSRNCLCAGNGVATAAGIAVSAGGGGVSRFRVYGGTEREEVKVKRRLHVLSSFGGEGGEGEEKHYGPRLPHAERKSSWTRPRQEKADVGRSKQTKWTASPLGSNGARGRARGGELGNDSRRGRVGFQGGVENDVVIDERRVAFENWAREKFREAGSNALPAIEEMRQTFAPGSRRLGPHLVTSELQPHRHVAVERNRQDPETAGRSTLVGSPIADARKPGMTLNANRGYGSSRVDRRGSSSSPTSRLGAGMSEQQLVARSSTRSESWSPKSSGSSRGSRSASNVASRTGVQFPAEESGKTTGGESTSTGRQSLPEPLLVKRKTKFPINFYGRGGTVMLVDKPQGWTSFAVCAKLRYLLKIQKVGHAGTLDPMATGLLIVCLGKATKLADSYQAMTKVYSGTLRLGELTPSLDADTEVSDVLPWEHITDDQLEQAKKEFIGDIFQRPPMYSAIKVDGERLYVKARKGEQIEVPARLVTVNDFQLERSSENRQDIHFRVTCAKGTYIRTLCADLAQAVGSYAHLVALRREKIGTYGVKDAWPILEFVEQYSQIRDIRAIHAKT